MAVSNREIEKENIIRAIRAIATASGGVPPGERKFTSETGMGPHVWRYRLWKTWSDALADAGFSPLEWGGRHDDTALLGQVAGLGQRLGRFPNSSDIQFEAANNPTFPSYNTIKRRWKMVELASAVREFAVDQDDKTTIAHCDQFLASARKSPDQPAVASGENGQLGYVYLMSYGKDYKIGRTSSPSRRARQVRIELPDETVLVHAILTDDPTGIEAYWHRRFSDKRGSGEWFRLSPDDIRAFRRWTKIA